MRRYGAVMFSVAYLSMCLCVCVRVCVCVSVCLYVCNALTFESLDHRMSFWSEKVHLLGAFVTV